MEESLGERIQRLLDERSMTRKEFCAMTGLTEAALSRYISGVREPRALTLSIIAKGLDVSVDELLGTPCDDPETLDGAVNLVARSNADISPDQRRLLIRMLMDY